MGEPAANTTVFVTGFPNGTTEQKIKQVIGEFGTLKSIKLLPGSGKNAALIQFADLEEAKWFRENLDGNIPEGLTEVVTVRYSSAQDRAAGGGASAAGIESIRRDAGVKTNSWGAAQGGGGGQNRWNPMGGGGGGGGWGAGGGGGKGGMLQIGVDGVKDSVQMLLRGLRQANVLPGGKGGQNNSEGSLFIKGLPEDTTNEDMYNIFAPFGAIPSNGVKVLLTDTGECRGIGFVNFLEPEPAQNAMNTLNGTMLPSGKVLFIQPNTKDSKGASGGKGGRNWGGNDDHLTPELKEAKAKLQRGEWVPDDIFYALKNAGKGKGGGGRAPVEEAPAE